MRNLFKGLSVVGIISIGIIIGLVISGNFDLTKKQYAQDNNSVANYEKKEIDNDFVEQLNSAFTNAANNALPSVVTISTTQLIKTNNYTNPLLDDFFRDFFGIPYNPGPRKAHALGSGVIVDKKGYILTNNHVVEHADSIKVTLFDGTEIEAKLIGKSKDFDIAVLKVDYKNLQPIKIGDSDKLKIGEWVLAIGSPFSKSLRHTVTQGIISAKGRNPIFGNYDKFENYIQTSAAINPGNSGGALINLKGELIGINTAIVSSSGGNQGIGFAIPINTAMKVMHDLIDKGYVVRPWLGVKIGDITPALAEALNLKSQNGAFVQSVVDKSPADKAGIKEKDVIVKIDDQKIENSFQLKNIIGSKNPGDKVSLTIIRNGKTIKLDVKLEEMNKDEVLASDSDAIKPEIIEQLGIKVSNITPSLKQRYGLENDEKGVVIINVDPRSIGASTGLREGDVIKEIGNMEIKNIKDYRRAIAKLKKGKAYIFLIKRGSDSFYIGIKIPED